MIGIIDKKTINKEVSNACTKVYLYINNWPTIVKHKKYMIYLSTRICLCEKDV